MKIRFAILPPAKIDRLASKLAKQAASRGPHDFVVDDRKVLPHITLFVLDWPQRRLDKVMAEYQKFVGSSGVQRLKLQIIGYQTFEDLWFSLKVKKTSQLSNLQHRLSVPFKKYELKNKNGFLPHITLTRYQNGGIVRTVAKNMKKVKTHFIADTIGVCLSNKYSQVYKILYKIRLKK